MTEKPWRSRGSTEGPVKFLSTRDLLFGQKKLSFTGTGFKPTFLEISFIMQLVKNNIIQSNFPGNFHDKISLRISLLQEELKNVVIYNYKD
jgi:hypothetical protein